MMHGSARADMDLLAVELHDYSARAFRLAPITSVPDVLNGAPGVTPIGNEEPAPGGDDEGRRYDEGIAKADGNGQGGQSVDSRRRQSTGRPDDEGYRQRAATTDEDEHRHELRQGITSAKRECGALCVRSRRQERQRAVPLARLFGRARQAQVSPGEIDVSDRQRYPNDDPRH